jgi:hypothetical protein
VLLCSLGALRAAGDTDWGALERLLWSSLLPPFLTGHANSGLVLRRLWDSNPAALLKGMGLWAGGDIGRVARLVDLLAQLGVLHAALEVAPLELSLDLADAAARRELLGATLDGWLAERLARQGGGLVRPVARYLEARMAAAPTPPPQLPLDQGRAPPPQLACETAACLLRGLHAHVACGGGADLASEVSRAQAHAVVAYPGAEALLAAAAAVPAAGSSGGPFSSDVEEEANMHFHSVSWQGIHEERPAGMHGPKASACQRCDALA